MAYIDQASFLGLRGLGRGPLEQFTWIYEHPVNLDGLRRFQRNLSYGLMGRRVETSPLPFGRHRWVAFTGPDELDIASMQRPRDEVLMWADEQLRRPIDPELGPPWRLAVQPLVGGGAAVTLIASHTLCDGVGMILAITEAAQGVRRCLHYPPAGARSGVSAVIEDVMATIRAIPSMAAALVAMVRIGIRHRSDVRSAARRAAPPAVLHSGEQVSVPVVVSYIDQSQWNTRAQSLGGTSNALFAAIASRLGQLQGRAGADGVVTLSIPVSERTEGDTRGNALTGVMISSDPAGVTADLQGIRADIKKNLSSLAQNRHSMTAPLPLTPFIPKRLVSKLEGMALGSGFPVGISNMGVLDPGVNQPDGTDAEFIFLRQSESRITADILDRLGGTLFLACGQVRDMVSLSVSGWQPATMNTRSQLADAVRQVLAEFGLDARFE